MRPALGLSAVLASTVLGLSLTAVAPAVAASPTTVTPSSGTNDGTKSFVLSGPAATSKEAVVLKLAGHPDITGTVSNPDAGTLCSLGISDSDCGTSITVSVPLLNAFPGHYDVVRTQTPSGLGGTSTTTTTAAAFQVLSKPSITSISPATRGQDSNSPITITGTGFGPDSVVTFGDGTTVSDVTLNSTTELVASVLVAPTAALGARDVTVTSADDLSSTKPGALTVAPKPTLTSVAPASGLRGESLTGVVLTGTGFASGSDFAVTIPGVAVSNAVVSPDGTTITANLAIANDAVSGNRTVQVTNADGGRVRLVNGFRVIAPPGAPALVAAIAADAKATVGWTLPADPGSSPITGWVVTPSNPSVAAVTLPASARQTVFTGLTNGAPISFSIHAKNDDAGNGPDKATTAVTPKLIPVLTLVANRTAAISGQSTTFYGYVRRLSTNAPLAGIQVKLHVAPGVGAAADKVLITDANGRYSYAQVLTYSTTVTASTVATADRVARTSVVSVPVGTKITVSSPTSGAVVGSPFTVRGSVSPNKAGKQVGLYKVVNGTATLIGRGTIAANGTYAVSVRLPVGNYLLKVTLGPTTGNASGVSPQFVVKRR